MNDTHLAGRRILVIEDEALLSMDICDQIEAHGGVVVGPASTMVHGYALLGDASPDGGILNIRIGDQMIYPLARVCMTAGIPIIFASSESRSSIPTEFEMVPLLDKPVDMIAAIKGLFPIE
ncbi:hypothetical protein [Falsirhodobacter xinxiangensis]|uniref:hypothetical protein n=1 Tax=Falsirhodobacter xinxiangensis TaxID=2530049 RepID=UPI0010A9D1B5|nr:hypothetical protein [Rhodobacter xinxiangensis]